MALNDSQPAYSVLLNRHYEGVRRYVGKLLHNNTYVCDIVQETFDKAFSKLGQYNEGYQFTSWLYRIARNSTVDFVRKHRFNTLHIDYGSDQELSINESLLNSGTPSPEDDMIRHQEEKRLMESINSMKPKYRQIIEMRYIREYAYEEIASELNMPMGTVKAQLFRAKNILIEKMLGQSL